MDINALRSQAAQSAAQGQQLLAQDQAQAAQYKGQYDTDTQQAAQANTNLQQYTDYMKNAGNPLNLYNQGISQAEQTQGFDPRTLATATQNLTQTENQIGNVNAASQSSTGGYGLSGSQLGQYYGSLSQPLQQAASAQNTAVGNMQQLYQNALTQGQQGATLGFQGEQQTSANLNQIYQNAQNQAAQAMSNMQFYSQLASTQGGLNAQQQQEYAGAVAGLQQAQAAMQSASAAMIQARAQAGLAGAQTAQIQQAIAAANKMGSSGGISAPRPNAGGGGGGGPAWYSPSNIENYLAPGIKSFAHGAGDWAKGLFTGASW